MIVVDASVCVKWVLSESDSAVANELLENSCRLAAPGIVKIEVAGAVIRRFRSGALTEDLSRSACEKWDQILEQGFVQLIPVDSLYVAAVELTFRSRHALADCLYIAAAQSLDAKLLTADQTLLDRGRKVYDRICTLVQVS